MSATPAALPAMQGALPARDTVPIFSSQAGFTTMRHEQMFRRMCSDNTTIIGRSVISVEKVTLLLSQKKTEHIYIHLPGGATRS